MKPTDRLRRAAMHIEVRYTRNAEEFDAVHRVANAIDAAAAGDRGPLDAIVREQIAGLAGEAHDLCLLAGDARAAALNEARRYYVLTYGIPDRPLEDALTSNFHTLAEETALRHAGLETRR